MICARGLEIDQVVKFEPKMGEEELTNQRVRLTRTGLFLFASVFPTDESMASAKGVDSIKLGWGCHESEVPMRLSWLTMRLRKERSAPWILCASNGRRMLTAS
jgi:hypothetical protein